MEKYDSSSDCSNSDLTEPLDHVNAKKPSRRIRFLFSCTSTFLGASLVLEKVGKDVLLLRWTLAYGTKYTIGVFCLTEEGGQQMVWAPEKQLSGSGFCSKGTSFSKLSSQN